MTLLAHAGHWAGQLLYLAPVLAMVVAILWAKIRGHGQEGDELDGGSGDLPRPSAPLSDRSE
jgi:hypothetical protein